MTAQPSLLLETEFGEHVEQPVLAGDDVDDQLDHAELEGFDDGSLGEQPADAALSVLGGDHQAQLADVTASADALEHGDVAGDVAVDEGDEAMTVGHGDPAGDDDGVRDVLLEERAVTLGHGREEGGQRLDVVVRQCAHLDVGAWPRRR